RLLPLPPWSPPLPYTTLFRSQNLYGAQHALVLALGEHDARALGRHFPRSGVHRLHDRAGLMDELLKLLTIALEVLDRPRRDAGIHRRLRDRRCDVHDEPRIERFRDQILGTEREILDTVRARDDV